MEQTPVVPPNPLSRARVIVEITGDGIILFSL